MNLVSLELDCLVLLNERDLFSGGCSGSAAFMSSMTGAR